MPAYSFQPEFVLPILDGLKPHTIRRRRKNPTRPGYMIKMFVGMRTKRCFQFGEAPCVKITPVVIYPFQGFVKVNRRILTDANALELAKKDGFLDLNSFFKFFQRYEQEILLDFELVEWDPMQVKDMREVRDEIP